MLPRIAQNFSIIGGDTAWRQARLSGLVVGDVGLTLARLPSLEPPVTLPGPYTPTPSPFAATARGELVFALADERALLFVDPNCAEARQALRENACSSELPLTRICGCASAGGRLFIVCEDTPSVFSCQLPGLELSAIWRAPRARPKRVAVDANERVYVLDVGEMRVMRFTPDGRVDASYHPVVAEPLELAVAADGTAIVSVAAGSTLLCFAPDGAQLAALPLPFGDFAPAAMTALGQRLYVADASSGSVWAYDVDSKTWLGPLPGWRGPVHGLATDATGNVYVRIDAGERYARLEARAAYAARGSLAAGPFDAGEDCIWQRLQVDVELPRGCRARVESQLSADGGLANDWHVAPALDSLLRAPQSPDAAPDHHARFLRLRIALESDDPRQSPCLRRISAETPGEDYLARLPAVYARRDAETGGFLRTFLASFGAELSDRGLQIAELARHFDPATAPADHLSWLASWIGYDLPDRANVSERRAQLLDAQRLYEQRGTRHGLRELIRLHVGIDCEIVEDHSSRALWSLDGAGQLGFDTGLLPCLPDGMVVPGPARPDPMLQGLLAEYFLGADLARAARHPDHGGDRCEPRTGEAERIDPDGTFPDFRVPALPTYGPKVYSVSWTGQLCARYSELYTLALRHHGGARLYVDEQLLIDTWPRVSGSREPRGYLPLSAGRWSALRIEYWSDQMALADARPRLIWSSASQELEPVPQACLYARSDDNVASAGESNALVVGAASVGQHGPLAAADFGSPLFDDTAHRFLVQVRAADVRRPGTLAALRALLDAEKPAHTGYRLCVVESTFRVGIQARVGGDAYVAAPPPPARLGAGELDVDARLGAGENDRLRVEETLRLGNHARLR